GRKDKAAAVGEIDDHTPATAIVACPGGAWLAEGAPPATGHGSRDFHVHLLLRPAPSHCLSFSPCGRGPDSRLPAAWRVAPTFPSLLVSVPPDRSPLPTQVTGDHPTDPGAVSPRRPRQKHGHAADHDHPGRQRI